MIDPITEADLLAFVDSQLDIVRRIEVEEYLARNPEVAARVMADLRARDALGLAFNTFSCRHPAARTLDATRRLERGLAWRRVLGQMKRTAAIVLLVAVGWFGHAYVGLFEISDSEAAQTPPIFVEDARHSHATALIRARMVSQPEAVDYDPVEILTETGIRLPPLPSDWRVVDAQVFPSRLGHSVEIAFDADEMGRVSLFIARSPEFSVIAPALARSGTSTTAYWQSGELVYALTASDGPESDLKSAAERLYASLR